MHTKAASQVNRFGLSRSRGLGDPRRSSKQMGLLNKLTFSMRAILISVGVIAIAFATWLTVRDGPYVGVERICVSLARGDLAFVNRHLRYGRFVENGDELEFHYTTSNGDDRVVYWGNARSLYRNIQRSNLMIRIGNAELTDATHQQSERDGLPHDFPRVYDVVFQTNRRDGKVAIMAGGSNAFPYSPKDDEP